MEKQLYATLLHLSTAQIVRFMVCAHLSVGALDLSGGHAKPLPLADLDWIDNLVKPISQVSNKVLVLCKVP
jgi:hypothetical protein